MLGRNSIGLHGNSSGNRSLDGWQDETNADKFGARDAVAIAYDRTGLENIAIAEPHTFGDVYYESYFLDIDEEKSILQDGRSQSQQSFDLIDMVLSTGAAKK